MQSMMENHFQNLIEYMTSAPVLVQVLEGESALSQKQRVDGTTILKMPLLEQLEQILQNL